MSIEITGIEGFPIVKENDDLKELIYNCLLENDITLKDDDVLVLAETVVSKAESNMIKVDDVIAGKNAEEMAKKSGKDTKQCQIILDNTKSIIRCQEGLIITETPHGFICANSGVDNSNAPEGFVTPLPLNPDRSAAKIKKYLDNKFDCDCKIIISDTHGRAWRVGAIGVAVGISGMHPVTDCRGSKDLYGQQLQSTMEATADELASAASLLMGQADNGICLVLIRGYDLGTSSCKIGESSINEIIRDKQQDAFR